MLKLLFKNHQEIFLNANMSSWLILISVIFFFGCTTPQVNYIPNTKNISVPPLNSINSISIGDVMLKQGKHIEHDAIYVKGAINVGLYTIHPGLYLKTGYADDVEFFYPGGTNAGRIEKSAFADNWTGVIVRNGSIPEICVLTAYNTAITTCSRGDFFQRLKAESLQQNSFQQTLIYSGKVGNKINITYREYYDNLARPAFSNDVEYDLTESNTIAYKGSLLEILEANNQFVKFKVIRNFNMD